MEDNINNAISQLQNMLSSEDGMKSIENMLGSFGGTNQNNPVADLGNMGGMISADSIAKMKNVMDAFQRRDDPRSQLLLALKPYLSPSRGARIETALTLLSLGKIPSIIKNMQG